MIRDYTALNLHVLFRLYLTNTYKSGIVYRLEVLLHGRNLFCAPTYFYLVLYDLEDKIITPGNLEKVLKKF